MNSSPGTADISLPIGDTANIRQVRVPGLGPITAMPGNDSAPAVCFVHVYGCPKEKTAGNSTSPGDGLGGRWTADKLNQKIDRIDSAICSAFEKKDNCFIVDGIPVEYPGRFLIEFHGWFGDFDADIRPTLRDDKFPCVYRPFENIDGMYPAMLADMMKRATGDPPGDQ
eukprot:437499_1